MRLRALPGRSHRLATTPDELTSETTKFQEELALAVGGRSQALLLNFEEELTTQFGVGHSLATKLRFPVFIGSFTTEGQQALERLHAKLPKELKQFIVRSANSLPDAVREDEKYDMRLRVFLELAKNPAAGLAIQFVRAADMTAEQKALLENTGVVIIREQQRDVSNRGWLKPQHVVRAVAVSIPFKFNMSHFIKAWRAESVRPRRGGPHPETTVERYCRYDEPHRDYTYSQAYVDHLAKHLSTAEGYRALLGLVAVPNRVEHAAAS
ncbi:MAG: DUF3644 domain-containing protein [Mycobacterium sp.]